MTNRQLAIEAVRTYAEMHPRPHHVTQKQAAKMLDLSVPTVRKMIACGALKLNKCGLIPINEVDRAMEAV